MGKLRFLVSHFFSQFFENETLPYGEAATAKFISLLSILAVVSGAIAYWENLKYVVAPLLLPYRAWAMDTSWRENFYFLGLCGAIMGIVSLLHWRELFLSRRDAQNLSYLPISSLSIFLAKSLSLLGFVGLFSFSMAIFSSPLFGLGRAKVYGNSLWFFLKFSFAHGASVFALNLFVFLSVLSLSGFFTLMLGKNSSRFAVYFQSGLLIFFLSVLGIMDRLAAGLSLEGVREGRFLKIPLLWFTGVYETISGINPKAFHRPFFLAITSLVFLFAIFIAEYWIFYALQIKGKSAGDYKAKEKKEAFSGILRVFFPRPLQRAVYQFVKNVFASSPRHRLLFFAYVSVPVGLFSVKIARLLYHRSFSHIFLFQFMHLFFLLVILGERAAISLPYFPQGSWIFRLTEKKEKKDYLLGLRKTLILIHHLPSALGIFLLFSILWGPLAAFLQTIYALAVSISLLTLSLVGYRKLPFVSASAPGKAKLHIFWFFYLVGIYAYIYILGWIGKQVFKKPVLFLPLLSFLILLAAVIEKTFQRRCRFSAFIYQEEPSHFMELNL